MKYLLVVLALATVVFAASCEVQSEMAKKSVEKYQPTPTPSISPTPTEEPIDPADVVNVDTSLVGDTLIVNGPDKKETLNCSKFNKVMINNGGSEVTIKGVCKQLMINGESNKVTAEAIVEIVVNGSENEVTYTKFANGKRPLVTENRPGNTIEKTVAE